MNNATSRNTPIYSGLKDWDEAIDGFVPGQLIIVAGRPAMGKTAFAITLLKKLAIIRNIPVAFFSLEMTSPQIVMRLLANIFNCSPHYLREGPQCEIDDCTIMAERVFKDTPLYLDDTLKLSLKTIDAKIAELKSEGIKVVIIDHIQLIGGFNKDVEIALATLKQIAEKHKISLIALSQVSRSDMEILPDGTLDVESSRHIFGEKYSKYSDIISVIHRPAYYSEEIWSSQYRHIAKIHFVTNNHSDTKCIKLKFDDASAKFSNIN